MAIEITVSHQAIDKSRQQSEITNCHGRARFIIDGNPVSLHDPLNTVCDSCGTTFTILLGRLFAADGPSGEKYPTIGLRIPDNLLPVVSLLGKGELIDSIRNRLPAKFLAEQGWL